MRLLAALAFTVFLTLTPLQAETTHSDDVLEDVARDYWHGRLLARAAANRTCAIKDFPLYNDPESPFRRNDERMRLIEAWLDARDPEAITAFRPRGPFPPPQMLCDDEDSAHRAIADYDAKVANLVRRLSPNKDGA